MCETDIRSNILAMVRILALFLSSQCTESLPTVVGGPAIRYCNVASDVLKQAAIRALKADCPVWFGCDVNKVSNTHEGVMDLNLYHYDDALGTKVKMTKKERLISGDSSMTQ